MPYRSGVHYRPEYRAELTKQNNNEMKHFMNISVITVFLVACTITSHAQTIMDVNTFRNEFNALSSDLRVVITNDPDCGSCLYMIQELFDVIEDPNGCGLNDGITYFFNWTKVLGGTTVDAVPPHTVAWSHPRYIHYWDETQILGDLLFTTLGLVDPSVMDEYTAWHTTLCYEPGIVWDVSETSPPTPTFWIHKLNEQYQADQSLFYSDSLFAAGFNALACLTSIDENPLNDRLTISGNGTDKIVLNFVDLEKNAQIKLLSMDGKTAITYPVRTSVGSLELTETLSSGMYIYSLIENGKMTGSDKLIITKNQ
jgi:hypothetical protein